jgi:hypothetical protein
MPGDLPQTAKQTKFKDTTMDEPLVAEEFTVEFVQGVDCGFGDHFLRTGMS